ncbi:hypothetical protein [Winogradskyella thalassocola]|uniref:Lipoprotein n=1 Tax=Winogradskyella thalassocola TaxID=262004 RepID=A0A1G8HQ91_9FLAO|nr:hypothetical protein [Winogradskyella thalassocola]SDI08661.1 hypothetical protein SAMN04489796_10711 [Winogradskyella thalassocola]
MKPQLKFILTISLFCLIIACNNNNSQTNSIAYSTNDSNVAIQVTMEGKSFKIKQNQLIPQIKTKFKNDSILLVFRDDDTPLQLNFNVFNTDILSKQSAIYTIPDTNAVKQKVDLNFFNNDRDVKRMNKRIIFRKGTINISKLTDKVLQMTFEGEGSGITEHKKTFPISGKVNVIF